MAFELKVAKEVAETAVSQWLDNKCVEPDLREDRAKSVKKLVSAVMYGMLVINADGSLTHNLHFPVGKDGGIKSFTYKSRLTCDELEECLTPGLSGAKAYGFALSGQPSGLFGKLDTADLAVLDAIVVFFTN